MSWIDWDISGSTRAGIEGRWEDVLDPTGASREIGGGDEGMAAIARSAIDPGDLFGTAAEEDAERAAEIQAELERRALSAEERMQARQMGFLAGERRRTLQEIGDITGDWRTGQAGYEQRLREAMTSAAQERGALGGLYQQQLLGGLGLTREQQLAELERARTGVTGTLADLGTRGEEALTEAMQLGGRPLDIDITEDPSYQFRVQEGMRAIESSAAARGMQLSGRTLKGLQRYGQQMATQEYGAAYDRAARLRQERLETLGRIGGYGTQARMQQALQLSQLGTTAATLTPEYTRGIVDPRAGAVDYTAAIQDPGRIHAAQLGATTGVAQQYTGDVSASLAQLGQSQSQYWQNMAAISAAQSQAQAQQRAQMMQTGMTAAAMIACSRDYKENYRSVESILPRIEKLTVEAWDYKKGYEDEQTHIGPYAEEFKELFGVGNGKEIAVVDAIGVCLLGIKELKARTDCLLEN